MFVGGENLYGAQLSGRCGRADFFRLVRAEARPEYIAKLSEVNLRWRSNHRYLTERQLLSYLNNTDLDRRIRGDRLKFNSRKMYDLAESIVGLGVLKWTIE